MRNAVGTGLWEMEYNKGPQRLTTHINGRDEIPLYSTEGINPLIPPCCLGIHVALNHKGHLRGFHEVFNQYDGLPKPACPKLHPGRSGAEAAETVELRGNMRLNSQPLGRRKPRANT